MNLCKSKQNKKYREWSRKEKWDFWLCVGGSGCLMIGGVVAGMAIGVSGYIFTDWNYLFAYYLGIALGLYGVVLVGLLAMRGGFEIK